MIQLVPKLLHLRNSVGPKGENNKPQAASSGFALRRPWRANGRSARAGREQGCRQSTLRLPFDYAQGGRSGLTASSSCSRTRPSEPASTGRSGTAPLGLPSFAFFQQKAVRRISLRRTLVRQAKPDVSDKVTISWSTYPQERTQRCGSLYAVRINHPPLPSLASKPVMVR
jgi:hypothetical protein